MTEPQCWHMYAEERNGVFWYTHKDEFFVKLHDCPKPTPVLVTEAPEGRYHGWLPSNEEMPCFIWPSEAQRDMCFPYGPEVAERAGRGRRIRLSIRSK